jgi:hypothetical protein
MFVGVRGEVRGSRWRGARRRLQSFEIALDCATVGVLDLGRRRSNR